MIPTWRQRAASTAVLVILAVWITGTVMTLLPLWSLYVVLGVVLLVCWFERTDRFPPDQGERS